MASNRNGFQEYFLRVKAVRCVGLTALHPHVPVVLKSVNLNLLEPSGPVQACNGTAFTTIICVIAWGTVLQKLIILCKKGSHPLMEC